MPHASWLRLSDREFIKQRLHMVPLTAEQAARWLELVQTRTT